MAELSRLLPGGGELMQNARSWWPESHAWVLDNAGVLLTCPTPTDLEDAVCDLLARNGRRQREQHTFGFNEHEWLQALIDTAKGHAAEPAIYRLIYGIAVIADPVMEQSALDLLHVTELDDAEPAWLGVDPTVAASPDLMALRDAYGLRFGLLAQVTVSGAQPRTYLYDIDLCHGMDNVLTSGYHPDPASAVAAWRGLVGASADHAEPFPAPADLLPHILPGGAALNSFMAQPLTDSQLTEVHRADRIAFAIADALEEAGRPVAWAHTDGEQVDDLVGSLASQFRVWAEAAGIDIPADGGPDDDIVTWLLHDWVALGLPEALSLACSPHRIAAFTAYLLDDWQLDPRERALAMLEPWVRFCAERTGLTGPPLEHTLAWAARAAVEPAVVGDGLGNHLNRPIDETTVVGPPLPDYAR